jgi:hypothetical protein
MKKPFAVSLVRFLIIPVFSAGTLLVACNASAQTKAGVDDLDQRQLTATITALDSRLFTAYNQCDLKTFGSLIAPDVEFYHDKGGLTLGRDKLVASVKDNICGKVRRELLPGTLEVYPIAHFGAVETGSHRFCELGTGKCEGQARFVHLWQFRNGAWYVSRVISYDHHLVAK